MTAWSIFYSSLSSADFFRYSSISAETSSGYFSISAYLLLSLTVSSMKGLFVLASASTLNGHFFMSSLISGSS